MSKSIGDATEILSWILAEPMLGEMEKPQDVRD